MTTFHVWQEGKSDKLKLYMGAGNLNCGVVITAKEAAELAELLTREVARLPKVVTAADLGIAEAA